MKERILSAALYLATKHNYQQITRTQIAERVGCAESLVSFHFGTMVALRAVIMRKAIEVGNLIVIAQGLAAGNSVARGCNAALRRRAAEKMAAGR